MKIFFKNIIKKYKLKYKLNHKSRKPSSRVDIDHISLQYLYHKQYRLCIYTNDNLSFKNDINKICLDKIDRRQGYTSDNIQLVTWKVYHIKCCLKYDFHEIVKSIFNNKILISKPILYKSIKFNRKQRSFILNLLKTCKMNCIKRKKQNRIESSKYKITLDDIEELYNDQCGKCIYSGINLTFNKSDSYKLSIDRIDSDKGYINDNIQLVLWSVNQAKGNMFESDFLSSIYKIHSYGF
jgi:hypothetical protein